MHGACTLDSRLRRPIMSTHCRMTVTTYLARPHGSAGTDTRVVADPHLMRGPSDDIRASYEPGPHAASPGVRWFGSAHLGVAPHHRPPA